jgi:hypothetical protein
LTALWGDFQTIREIGQYILTQNIQCLNKYAEETVKKNTQNLYVTKIRFDVLALCKSFATFQSICGINLTLQREDGNIDLRENSFESRIAQLYPHYQTFDVTINYNMC